MLTPIQKMREWWRYLRYAIFPCAHEWQGAALLNDTMPAKYCPKCAYYTAISAAEFRSEFGINFEKAVRRRRGERAR